MPIFTSAYDTTVGSAYTTKNTIDALRQFVTYSSLSQNIHGAKYNIKHDGLANGSSCLPYLVCDSSKNQPVSIPVFGHPLFYSNGRTENKDNYLAIDARHCTRALTTRDPEYNNGYTDKVTNPTEFSFVLARCVTEFTWHNDAPMALKNISFLPCKVFSSWVSEQLQHAFNLETGDQMKIAAIAAFYYRSLFENNKDTWLSEENKLREITWITKNLKLPSNFVSDVIYAIESPILNVRDLAEAIKNVVSHQRLTEFNAGLLVTILGNSWYGHQAKELLAVSLEHPPTWIAIVYVACKEKSYKNSSIVKICDRHMGPKGVDIFIKSFMSFSKTILA